MESLEELFLEVSDELLFTEGVDGSPSLRSEDDSAKELFVSFSGSARLLLSSPPQAASEKTKQTAAKKLNDTLEKVFIVNKLHNNPNTLFFSPGNGGKSNGLPRPSASQ